MRARVLLQRAFNSRLATVGGTYENEAARSSLAINAQNPAFLSCSPVNKKSVNYAPPSGFILKKSKNNEALPNHQKLKAKDQFNTCPTKTAVNSKS
jgi:hypothetical protein